MYSPLIHIASKNFYDSEIFLRSCDDYLKVVFPFEIRRDQPMEDQ
jgi:hypothetical protein